jgi:hypothetical protein
MKAWKMTALLALGAAVWWPAHAEVGVSIDISQPGVHGRVDIGRFPSPQVVLPRPVIIHPAPQHGAMPAPPREPVYLWVPPGHRRDWRRYCAQYNACEHPVYFVRDDWYDRHIGHGPRDERRRDHDYGDRRHGRGEGRGDGRGEGHGDGRSHRDER